MVTSGRTLRTVLGLQVRRLRGEAGLTQEQLAGRARLASRHLQKIEAGEVNLTLATLERLAQALQVNAASLLEPPPARGD